MIKKAFQTEEEKKILEIYFEIKKCMLDSCSELDHMDTFQRGLIRGMLLAIEKVDKHVFDIDSKENLEKFYQLIKNNFYGK